MTEEEKKAIEYIKEFQKELYGASSKNLMAHYLDIVLNLINNQQKEIEELKKDRYLYNAKTGEITKLENSESISKDKIRGKIEQLEIVKNTPVKDNNYTYKECIEYGIEELKELLEE